MLFTITMTRPVAASLYKQTKVLEQVMQLGWSEGHNVQIETRWSAGDPTIARKNAGELVALAPDVILATGTLGAGVILEATRSVPVVLVIVPDPVGSGFVGSLADPPPLPIISNGLL